MHKLHFVLLVSFTLLFSSTVHADTSEHTFEAYFQKAQAAYPENPKKALEATTRAELFAVYDMARVANNLRHIEWSHRKNELYSIYTWAFYHPETFRQTLNETLIWAKTIPAPTYLPKWMTGNDPDPYKAEHDPDTDWSSSQRFLEMLVNDSKLWDQLNKDIAPENALATLKARLVDNMKFSTSNMRDRKIIKNKLLELVNSFESREGTVSDRMVAITNEAQLLLANINTVLADEKTDQDLRDDNISFAQSVLRALSVASETYAATNDGKYPKKMTQLTNADIPYIKTNYCGRTINNYSFGCSMNAEGYTYTASPNAKKTNLKGYSITTNGILNEK